MKAAKGVILPEAAEPASEEACGPAREWRGPRQSTALLLGPRVLLVDDEPHLLEGLAASLRRHFVVETALGGEAGLAAMSQRGPFTVVVTDLRMPGMDGVAFLTQVREAEPEAIRVLLTGHADLDAAIQAINEGYIFRLLTKPCPIDLVRRAIDDAIEQARIVSRDRVLLQSKLDEMAAHLLHAERLASLGTMAAAVGHELNNVLSAFDTARRFIRRRGGEGRAPEEEDLKVLDWVHHHLAHHAAHLLRFGRPEAMGSPVADLGKTAGDVLAMMWTAGVTRRARVELAVPPRPVRVRMHQVELEQILVNLLKNAVDAVSEGASARAKIEVRVSLDEAGRVARCEVEDNGCGIAESSLPHIFKPYFTTKPSDRGTGLGLSVVKQIVEGVDGTIDVRSAENKGSRFVVKLPCAGFESAPPTEHGEAAGPGSSASSVRRGP